MSLFFFLEPFEKSEMIIANQKLQKTFELHNFHLPQTYLEVYSLAKIVNKRIKYNLVIVTGKTYILNILWIGNCICKSDH